MTEDQIAPMKIGLFDIMQIDPVAGLDVATMFANRLDDLAFADDLGFDVAFTAERHFLPPFAAASATAWLAAASQRTSLMRIGAMGYTLPIKTPVALAEEIATLDHLAGGRLEVGFGIGHRVEELIALGVDPNQRIPMFQERLALLKALWSGGRVTFEHGDIRLQDVAISPLSLQQPYPPLWYAGTEPIAAKWMGANGLGLAVGFKPTPALIPAVSAFLQGRNARSDEQAALDPARHSGTIALMRSVIVGESDQQVRDEVIDDLLRLEEAVGGDQSQANRPDRKRAAGEQFETMVATDVMIAGSVETVVSRLRECRERLRNDLFLANVYAMGASQDRIRATLRLLAGPVREQLAG